MKHWQEFLLYVIALKVILLEPLGWLVALCFGIGAAVLFARKLWLESATSSAPPRGLNSSR
jgi:hypothetical protein